MSMRKGKPPVLCLADKHRPGLLVCVHSDDLAALVADLAGYDAEKAQPGAVQGRLEGASATGGVREGAADERR